MLSGASATRAT